MSALSDRRQGTIAVATSDVDDLRKNLEEFEQMYAVRKAITKTFWQRAYEIMEAMHWNSAIFHDKTLLSRRTYKRLIDNHPSPPDIRTAMAICVGFDLDIYVTNDLLTLAGLSLSNSREHQAYAYIITNFHGKSIYERNAFLKALGLQPLGSDE